MPQGRFRTISRKGNLKIESVAARGVIAPVPCSVCFWKDVSPLAGVGDGQGA